MLPESLHGNYAKMKGYCARLALILHMLRIVHGEVGDENVDGESVGRAARLVAYFQNHARRVYAVIDADPRKAEARRALRWMGNSLNSLKTLKGSWEVSRSQLHSGVWGGSMDVDEVSSIIALLLRYGWLRQQEEEQKKGPGRRPSPRYEIHPSLFSRNLPENSDISGNCTGRASS
jgi:hypothetical protein